MRTPWSGSGERLQHVQTLVGGAQVPAMFINRHFRVGDVLREPFAVSSRYEHVGSAIANLDRDSKLPDLEPHGWIKARSSSTSPSIRRQTSQGLRREMSSGSRDRQGPRDQT